MPPTGVEAACSSVVFNKKRYQRKWGKATSEDRATEVVYKRYLKYPDDEGEIYGFLNFEGYRGVGEGRRAGCSERGTPYSDNKVARAEPDIVPRSSSLFAAST